MSSRTLSPQKSIDIIKSFYCPFLPTHQINCFLPSGFFMKVLQFILLPVKSEMSFFFLKRYTCLIFQFSHDFIFYLFASRIFTYLSSVLSPKFGIKNLHESESCSVVSDSLWLQGLYAMEFSREEYWCGSLPLLLGIFPTQGSNPGLLHCGWILYQLSHKGSPRILEWVAYLFSIRSSQPRNWTRVSCIAGRFFTSCAIEVIKMRTNKVIGKDVRIHALLTLLFL